VVDGIVAANPKQGRTGADQAQGAGEAVGQVMRATGGCGERDPGAEAQGTGGRLVSRTGFS